MSCDPPQQRRSRWRERSLATGMLLLWLVLVGRLLQLHLGNGQDFEKLAARQRVFRETVPARPGDIVDRNGHVFASSVVARSVFVVPLKIADPERVAQQLGAALGIDSRNLLERMTAHSNRQFLWVKRRISDAEADQVRALKLPASEWGFREEFRRHYPQGRAAAQVLGMRDIDGQGRGGIEETFQRELRGSDGEFELAHDARGRVIEVREQTDKPVVDGQTIVLTIDVVIQLFAEQALDDVMQQWKPKTACAVVLDPQTGDVLAMASRPTFDPGEPQQVAPEAWKNRSIADIYEPGSTFKPFVVAWALQKGCLARDEEFHCENGEYRMGRRVLHDHHRYGRLNVTDVLVKSSNIGMAKIGQRLTNSGLHQAAVAFGFGGRTGIEVPGELSGIVRPLKQWNSYSTGSVPMGQEIAVTPLQLVVAYGALANGGRLIAPHLVLRGDHSSSGPGAAVVSPVIDADIADWLVREPLKEVVSRGTGKKAALAGFTVFGKTGTAQKPDPVTGAYSRELHVSSFICGAPAENPRAIVLVSVDEPSVAHNGEHFGGSVAAPAAGELLRKVLQRLKVPASDLPPQTALVPEELRDQLE